jgi:hypothetical protein
MGSSYSFEAQLSVTKHNVTARVCQLNSTGSGKVAVADIYENGNELSDSTEGGIFLLSASQKVYCSMKFGRLY